MTSEPTFLRGQCEGIVYSMEVQAVAIWTNQEGNVNSGTVNSYQINRIRFYGPVSVEPAPGLPATFGSGTPVVKFNGHDSNAQAVSGVDCYFATAFPNSYFKNPQITSIQIVRVDGQPDDCAELIEHPANSPDSVPPGSCSPSIPY